MNNQYCVNCGWRIVSGKNFHTNWARLLKWVSTKLNGVDATWWVCYMEIWGGRWWGGVSRVCVVQHYKGNI